VRALAARPEFGGGPALVDGRVIYARPHRDGSLTLLAAPAGGGPAAPVARVPGPELSLGVRSWALAAAPAGLAVRVTDEALGPDRLWAGPLNGPLALAWTDFTRSGAVPFSVPGGPLVVERHGKGRRAVLRPPGGVARRVPLPAGADVRRLTVAGGLAVVSVPRAGEVAFVALDSGAVVARRPLGRWADTLLISLAATEDRELAASPTSVRPVASTASAWWCSTSAARSRTSCFAARSPRTCKASSSTARTSRGRARAVS
jgi:hypothetical protein